VKSLATSSKRKSKCGKSGVRDEASSADYGDCGKVVCCNTHLSECAVSMKMAKTAARDVDPSKIFRPLRPDEMLSALESTRIRTFSGHCPRGRDHHQQSRARVLAQKFSPAVLVETEDMRRIVIDAADVLTCSNEREATEQPTHAD